MFSAGAAGVTTAAAGAAAAIPVSAAAEEQKQDHNEPNAGTVVVVKAHVFHLTYLLVQYCMWQGGKMELVRLILQIKRRKDI